MPKFNIEHYRKFQWAADTKPLLKEFEPVVDHALTIFPWVHYRHEWEMEYSRVPSFISLRGKLSTNTELYIMMRNSPVIEIELVYFRIRTPELEIPLFHTDTNTDTLNLIGALRQLIDNKTIIKYQGTDYPELSYPPDYILGDLNNPEEPKKP